MILRKLMCELGKSEIHCNIIYKLFANNSLRSITNYKAVKSELASQFTLQRIRNKSIPVMEIYGCPNNLNFFDVKEVSETLFSRVSAILVSVPILDL